MVFTAGLIAFDASRKLLMGHGADNWQTPSDDSVEMLFNHGWTQRGRAATKETDTN